ncbi:MAG: hypothetical protein V4661_15530 [Pseudomonadota bacterium]
MIASILFYLALAALLGGLIHICIYRLIEAISRAWIDAQGLRHGGDDLSHTQGGIRLADLINAGQPKGE